MAYLIIFCAQYLIVLILLGVLLRGLLLRSELRRDTVLRLLVGGAIAAVLTKLAAYIYNDPRPFVTGHFTPLIAHVADNGFPSDHVVLGLVASLALFQADRRLRLALACLAIWVGFCRVLAGIHHVQDVGGSILIALLAMWCANLVLRLVLGKRP